MSVNDGAEGWTFLFGMFVGFCIGTIITCNVDGNYSKTNETIVEHGCARFNPTTADFEWLDTLSVPKDGVSTCTP
jgi:hypothetical protein